MEDLRYIPQNLGIMFGALPVDRPDIKPNTLGFGDPVVAVHEPGAQRSLFDPDCPLVMPIDIGTSILLSAPGLLLALFALRRPREARLTIGAGAHGRRRSRCSTSPTSARAGSSGATASRSTSSRSCCRWWPSGAARVDGRPRGVAVVLVVAGAAINLWGVIWGQLLGW